MVPPHSFKDYLFNLQATNKSEAKRMWRANIKDHWEHKCAYCESEENITLDHILPQCKGGLDVKTNVVACCHSCNQSKGHTLEIGMFNKTFIMKKSLNKIDDWMKPEKPQNIYIYRPRRNNAS
jgi:5-methylcytosine-specific restriction endonuclease McrA